MARCSFLLPRVALATALTLGGNVWGQASNQAGDTNTEATTEAGAETSEEINKETNAGVSEENNTEASDEEASEENRTEASKENNAEASVDGYYTPVERLTEHYLGSASRPVRYDWRKSQLAVGAMASELLERNNFGSLRVGGLVRRAFLDIMVEAGLTYVYVLKTESSEILKLTPYVQAGRPPRFEIDVNVSYPLAEAPVTPIIDLVPPAEIVLFATAGFRYLLYPQAVVGDRDWNDQDTWTNTSTWRDIGLNLMAPSLVKEDRLIIERDNLGGMLLDRARVHSLAGLTLDVYFQPGIFFSPRALIAIPLLAPVSETKLGFWWEMTLAAGYSF